MNSENIFSNPTLVWFIAGIVLGLVELIVPGLVLIFFGLGAWVTALLTLVFDANIYVQFIVFISASVISLYIFRKYLKSKLFDAKQNHEPNFDDDEFIGKMARVIVEIRPGNPGKVEFKGSTWSAMAQSSIAIGEMVKIIDKDSITLIVQSN